MPVPYHRAARSGLAIATLLVLAHGGATPLHAQRPRVVYDRVILGGRVIDPESRLDAIRNVGLAGDRIAAVTAAPIRGRDTLDARGLVVAPGFIDLHAHGQDDESYGYYAMDGVTTALELEGGVPRVAQFYAAREGKALVNFGAAASPGCRRSSPTPSAPGRVCRWSTSTAPAGPRSA